MDEILPSGVKLRDPHDMDGLRDDIHTDVMSAMDRYVNGAEFGDVRLEVTNMQYADKSRYSLAEQKEALLDDKTLARRLRGDLRLIDKNTNEVLDEVKGKTLARVPYLTPRGTMIHNGSEYGGIMQSRLLPGAYTRRRGDGEIETHFNVRPGTGSAMRLSFSPADAQYRLRVGSSNVHAYSVFRDLGVTDEELEARWGAEVLAMNKGKYDKRATERAYNKAVPEWDREEIADHDGRVEALRAAMDKAQMATAMAKQNLPNLYDVRKSASWRMVGMSLSKAASVNEADVAAGDFAPDTNVDSVYDSLADLDFAAEEALTKIANFAPDLETGDVTESYSDIHSGRRPRLASMSAWPDHWLNDASPLGWLQWFEGYENGERTEDDDRQKLRWKKFKARHGAAFKSNPTPRRAYALRNWAIDPLLFLPKGKREAFAKKMETYRTTEYMKWYLAKNTSTLAKKKALLTRAKRRGFVSDAKEHKALMQAAIEGFLKPSDIIK